MTFIQKQSQCTSLQYITYDYVIDLDHDTNTEKLEETALPFRKIEALLYDSKARKKLFLLDTCESGEFLDIGSADHGTDGHRGVKARAAKVFGSPVIKESVEAVRKKMLLDIFSKRDRLILQDFTRVC